MSSVTPATPSVPRARALYAGLMVLAIVVVAPINDWMSELLKTRSTTGAVILFAVLPLAAILTRPVIVDMRRNRPQRAIGIIWALRSRSVSFVLGSLGIWLLATVALLVVIVLLYRDGAITAAAAVSNWYYVASLLVLIVHLMPGQFRLPVARPVTIVLLGPRGAGKTSFIGLLPVDELPENWTMTPSAGAKQLTLDLHARAQGKDPSPTMTGALRHTFVRRRIWSQYSGVRPMPVDYLEGPQLDAQLLSKAGKRRGFVMFIPATLDAPAARAELLRQFRAIRNAGDLMARDAKVRAPVALAIAKFDLLGERITPQAWLSEELKGVMDQNCRRWEVFAISDRAAQTRDNVDLKGFAPKGYVDVMLWLLAEIT